MQKKFWLGLVVGLIGAAAGIALATALPTKYASHNSDMEGVVLYAYTSGNVLTPVEVNSSGAVVTTSTP
jgi:hypothetical protein